MVIFGGHICCFCVLFWWYIYVVYIEFGEHGFDWFMLVELVCFLRSIAYLGPLSASANPLLWTALSSSRSK